PRHADGRGGPSDPERARRAAGAVAARHRVAVAARQRRHGLRGNRRRDVARRVPALAVRTAAVIASGAVSPARARPTHDFIDQILALDPGRRGIATFFRPGAALAAAPPPRRAPGGP